MPGTRVYKYIGFFLLLISAVIYYHIAYRIERTEFDFLFYAWASLFAAYLGILFFSRGKDTLKIVGFSFIFRFIFILAVPELSNDFYRFIWDARLMLHGINPFEVLPKELINTPEGIHVDPDWILYEGMGDLQPYNFTCYPPVNQFAFLLGSLMAAKSITGSIIGLRLLILLADIGIVYFGKKLLEQMNLPPKNILIYALNPLVIIELTGNLHFEGLMLLFVILALLFLFKGNRYLSPAFFALGVSVKLIPLIFLPLFYKKLGLKRLLYFITAVIALNIILFLPFLSGGVIDNFWSSLNLYFRNFEFNASVYYIVRAVGYEIVGWNIIQTAGPVLSAISFLMILSFAFFAKNQEQKTLIRSMILVLTLHYFLSTTVMPWYIILILGLSVFYPYRFVLIWSFTAMLSYQAYANPQWQENLWVLFLEYLPVYIVLIYELFNGGALKKLGLLKYQSSDMV